MKILLINHTDSGGGAAIAALRITTALNNHGIYARLGVAEKNTDSPFVFVLPAKKHFVLIKILRKIGYYGSKLFSPLTKHMRPTFITSNNILHSTNYSSETDINWINNSDFDLVNLHWICGTICNKDISKITKPIVWTMHDSWPCCGAEHHPNLLENDSRWKEGYNKHNKPKSTKGKDICLKVWKEKKKYWENKKITFIAPSKWEHDILKSSALFHYCDCEIIPNIIPQDIFFQRNKENLREAFNIPKGKIVIGFGSAYDIDNPKSMKGSFYLIDALKKLDKSTEYFFMVFGPAGPAFTREITIPYFASGYIENPIILACLYSLCDLVVNPSLIENLPTTCLEALFCGVPSVAFDVGGTQDIVEHKKTGYLATPYNTDELVDGIEWCTAHKEELFQNCLEKAKKDFDEEKIIDKYLSVYSKALL
ncbi:MAG: glycosyltransferase [Treponemataceae bacterium]|nr:glycosyltransferase [Treponemataceae bacterium]